MGPNAKELFRLVEDFVDVIGFRMKDLRDAYQVTDNLGKPRPHSLTLGPHLARLDGALQPQILAMSARTSGPPGRVLG